MLAGRTQRGRFVLGAFVVLPVTRTKTTTVLRASPPSLPDDNFRTERLLYGDVARLQRLKWIVGESITCTGREFAKEVVQLVEDLFEGSQTVIVDVRQVMRLEGCW